MEIGGQPAKNFTYLAITMLEPTKGVISVPQSEYL